MKRFSEQFKKKSDSVRLRNSERLLLRERLESYMEYHPLPNSQTAAIPNVKTKNSNAFHINAWILGRMAGTIAVLFMVVIPVAAEKAVPGDVLYPVKVRFNEEIRSTLTFSPYQKVEWETERLERRISEARLLADAGKLTPEVEAEFAEAVKQHSDAAQKEIESIRQSDSDEAAIAEITLASALDVQSEVLEGHIEKAKKASSTENTSVAALAGAVSQARTAAAPKEGEVLSYEKLLARIEMDTTQAYEYFDSIDDLASPEEKKDIERRLSDIKQKVATAIDMTDDRVAAAKLLAGALSDTRKLISFITNIDVRENVTVEDLVPVTLTLEERSDAVLHLMNETGNLSVQLEERIATLSTTSEMYIEVSGGLDNISESMNTASSSLAAGDIDAAEKASRDAYALAYDLELLTQELVENEDESSDIDDSNTKATTTASGTISPTDTDAGVVNRGTTSYDGRVQT